MNDNLVTLPCGCDYDREENVIYAAGGGPGGCRLHVPEESQPPENVRLAVLNNQGRAV